MFGFASYSGRGHLVFGIAGCQVTQRDEVFIYSVGFLAQFLQQPPRNFLAFSPA